MHTLVYVYRSENRAVGRPVDYSPLNGFTAYTIPYELIIYI